MEAVTWLHTTAGVVLLGAFVLLALVAVPGSRSPALGRWFERGRRVLLGVVVAEAALGLTLALRGASPAETLHWAYGAGITGVLLAPSLMRDANDAHPRAFVMVGTSVLAALLAWRLWGTG
ncbi:MAG: hypothetical protein ACR2K4_02840 [Candidatus Limnocylindria bacterium]